MDSIRSCPISPPLNAQPSVHSVTIPIMSSSPFTQVLLYSGNLTFTTLRLGVSSQTTHTYPLTMTPHNITSHHLSDLTNLITSSDLPSTPSNLSSPTVSFCWVGGTLFDPNIPWHHSPTGSPLHLHYIGVASCTHAKLINLINFSADFHPALRFI